MHGPWPCSECGLMHGAHKPGCSKAVEKAQEANPRSQDPCTGDEPNRDEKETD